jgi:Fanconi-associated nuclease 1
MNSSPPPPSFTLPPLTSKGRLPVTPSPTPSPTDEQAGFRLSRGDKGKGKALEQDDGSENVGRISMYVKLFDGECNCSVACDMADHVGEEMITTVLESESYLFTPREIFVLRHILALPCTLEQSYSALVLC